MVKCVLLGATRGCGLETLLQLLAKGHACYVLSRSPAAFTATLSERGIGSDNPLLTTVPGDAFNAADVETLFATAGADVEFVLFSLGGKPTFANPLSPKLFPPHICERTITTFLPVFTRLYPMPSIQPRLVIISSNGLGTQGHADLPFVMKPLYGWLLKEPHADKVEMEKVVCKAAGIRHVDFNPDGVQEGSLGSVVVVRPSLLVDGEVRGKVRCGERLEGAWTVGRGDVGAWVVEECLPGRDEWVGKGVTVTY